MTDIRDLWTGFNMHFCINLVLLILLHGLTPVLTKTRNKKQGLTKSIPRIIEPSGETVAAELGEHLELTCKANSGSHRFPTIIYWLADNQFIEESYKDHRVTEGEEKIGLEDGRTIIQKSLKFTKTTQEDFRVKFTCVVMNPTGSSVKNITLDTTEAEVGSSSTRN
ncbi:interleukin-18 receptor accessory protein-like isoform X2 [Pristis pectinata]|uniref:interleukin-18 receptor accessory protein-like isoform X2 n=1 Tax=Pristis pectinata TaxID=685728 RepID=UPI00223DDEC8|nr:interleukin-18 receptor accessory protein-like isoform X2 [Pristis pectinata]